MDKQQKIIVSALAGLLLVALAVIVVLLCNPTNRTAEFVPPEFEKDALSGMPTDVPNELNYGAPNTQNEFDFLLCGTPALTDDGRLQIYFTSPLTNNVWLLLRIYDVNGDLIGESGLLRPGEYVENVELYAALKKGSDVRIKVLSYEMDTYYSKGTAQGMLNVAE